MTALIFGLALRSGQLRGAELFAGRSGTYVPPRDGWWNGEWRAQTEDRAASTHRAKLRMHGVLVLG